MRAERSLADLLLPFGVVLAVGMMLLPLPPALLDTLLVANISLSLALLVSCVYLANPERFTSLPTLLLLTTLFRLGLNISTTRQILSAGHAPAVVEAFGGFIVGGNLVVGIVLFVIMSIVQFLVVAKGAERVAEVAARFMLDAMPGKQMAIDADLRSGVLTLSEARERRIELQRESRLFGALDGAMKFVKGDAIAALLITVVNMFAGILLGMTEHGLSITEALDRYTRLSIGDALASQIPALLVAVSAGIAVTRVSERDGSLMSRDLFSQIGREPQALAVTATFLAASGLVPGLPLVPFLLMALFFGGASAVSAATRRKEQVRKEGFRPRALSPLLLRVTVDGARALDGTLERTLRGIRERVFAQMGVLLPEVQFDLEQEGQGQGAVLYLHGAEIARIEEDLSKGICRAVEQLVAAELPEFVDDSHTRTLLDLYDGSYGDLINSLIPGAIDITRLTRLFRRLVVEGVSIRELHNILQCAAEFVAERGIEKSSWKSAEGRALERDLLREVRVALRRSVTASLETREAYRLPSAVENILGQVEAADGAVELELARKINESVKRVGCRLIVAARSVRPLLVDIISEACPSTRVVTHEEVTGELSIMGELALENNLRRAA